MVIAHLYLLADINLWFSIHKYALTYLLCNTDGLFQKLFKYESNIPYLLFVMFVCLMGFNVTL
jgi:hypothetical protein